MSVQLSEEMLRGAFETTLEYANGLDRDFIEVGLEEIKNCGITGDKQVVINKTADSIAENMKDVTKQVRVTAENISSLLNDVVAFNANDVFSAVASKADADIGVGAVEERASVFPG